MLHVHLNIPANVLNIFHLLYIYFQYNLLLLIFKRLSNLFWVNFPIGCIHIIYMLLHSFYSQLSHLVCAVHASEASSRSECQSSVSSYLLKTIQEHTHLIGLKIQQNFTEYFCFDMNKAGANFLLQVRGCSLLVMIIYPYILFPIWYYCYWLRYLWMTILFPLLCDASVSVPPIFVQFFVNLQLRP